MEVTRRPEIANCITGIANTQRLFRPTGLPRVNIAPSTAFGSIGGIDQIGNDVGIDTNGVVEIQLTVVQVGPGNKLPGLTNRRYPAKLLTELLVVFNQVKLKQLTPCKIAVAVLFIVIGHVAGDEGILVPVAIPVHIQRYVLGAVIAGITVGVPFVIGFVVKHTGVGVYIDNNRSCRRRKLGLIQYFRISAAGKKRHVRYRG